MAALELEPEVVLLENDETVLVAGRSSQYAEEFRTQLEGLRSIQMKCDAASTALEEVRRIVRETERNAREGLRDLTLELGLASAARSLVIP